MNGESDDQLETMDEVGDRTARATEEIAQRYNERYRKRWMMLAAFDRLVRLMPRRAGSLALPPRRILIASGGHMGDLVICSSLIPLIKKAFPSAEIGLLVESWSSIVLKGHPDIKWVHVIDHFVNNRSKQPLWRKIERHAGAFRRQVPEIRKVGYDVAVDVRAAFPNFAFELWSAGIPVRIGYGSSGLESLFTHPHRYVYRGVHSAVEQAELLRCIGVGDEHFRAQKASLPATVKPNDANLVATLETRRCRILHVGVNSLPRQWPLSSWKQLASRLSGEGITVLFTGAGENDRKKIEEICRPELGQINLCDKLPWEQVVYLVQNVELVYCGETVLGHVAAAYNVPCVSIYGGMLQGAHFGPWSRNAALVTSPTDCAPCFLSKGCENMRCIRQTTAETVYAAGEQLLARRARTQTER